jgi:hypothetical protein
LDKKIIICIFAMDNQHPSPFKMGKVQRLSLGKGVHRNLITLEMVSNFNTMIYIYTLEDPFTGEIRYVGKTINLKNRFKQPKCGNYKWQYEN